MSRLELPCSDYLTDTKSVLDQAIRVIQAMIDIAAEYGFLATTLRLQMIMQACIQARWPNRDSSLLTLPYLREQYITSLLKPQLRNLPSLQVNSILFSLIDRSQSKQNKESINQSLCCVSSSFS